MYVCVCVYMFVFVLAHVYFVKYSSNELFISLTMHAPIEMKTFTHTTMDLLTSTTEKEKNREPLLWYTIVSVPTLDNEVNKNTLMKIPENMKEKGQNFNHI